MVITIKGALVAFLYSSALLAKAAIEAGYFHDRQSAKHTLFCWFLLSLGIGAAFCFSFLFDYLG